MTLIPTILTSALRVSPTDPIAVVERAREEESRQAPARTALRDFACGLGWSAPTWDCDEGGRETATTSRPDVTCAKAPAAVATGALLSQAHDSHGLSRVKLPERNPLRNWGDRARILSQN
jgi:hypothetical protein